MATETNTSVFDLIRLDSKQAKKVSDDDDDDDDDDHDHDHDH